MSAAPRILAFAGSARADSLNRKLLRAAAAAARAAGAEVTEHEFRDHPLPLYDGDLEAGAGLPEPVRRFKAALLAHDGLIVASPEYNSSLTPLLKNAIDWATRPEGKEPPLAAFRGKAAALVAASPGNLGGLRGLYHLREILQNIGVTVMPDVLALSAAHQAFAEDGALKDAAFARRVEALSGGLVALLRRLRG